MPKRLFNYGTVSKRLKIVAAATVVFLLAGGVVLYILKKPATPVVSAVVTRPMPPLLAVFPNQLDGTVVSSTNQIVPTVVGVMIDNHPDARPQAGLAQARVVYEAPVEGGLTRYFALFNGNTDLPRIGPVRSSRPYFLDWLDEYGNSYYWHVGGSPAAMRLLKSYGSRNADLYYLSTDYYTRIESREAPHNVYINNQNWQAYLSRFALSVKDWQGWPFSDSISASSTAITDLQIDFGSNYVVGWQFEDGRYTRMVNNKPLTDDAGTELKADTVVVQEVDVQVLDEEGRREITTVGGGEARVLRDGRLVRGTWKKTDRTSRTRFYDQAGAEIPLKPGQIWVEVVPQNTPMEVSS